MSGIAEDDGTDATENEADTDVATAGETDSAAEGEESTDADELDRAERRCGISLGDH